MLQIDDESYEVIGVMPDGFTYPLGAPRESDVYAPYVVPESQRIRDPKQVNIYLQCIGRLKPGVSVEQAQAQMDRIGAGSWPRIRNGTRAPRSACAPSAITSSARGRGRGC